jgi:hypothetical protein
MELLESEKERYDSYLDFYTGLPEVEYFVWGEEIINSKIYVYPKKLKNIPDYKKLGKRVVPCGFAFVKHENFQVGAVHVYINLDNYDTYIAEPIFLAHWKQLKVGIGIGIEIAKREGKPCNAQTPEDLVDLRYMEREQSKPVFKGGKIVYIQNVAQEAEIEESSAKLQKAARIKQSLLDNPKMIYFYDKDRDVVHDRSCSKIVGIEPECFKASETAPEGRTFCKECQRMLLMRIATYPNNKQAAICKRILMQHNISIAATNRFVLNYRMKFHATDLDEMQVSCGEDKWIIKNLQGKTISLWHNNYVKTSDTERYITDGYHDQKYRTSKLIQTLTYISEYTWQRHLDGEVKKAEAEAARNAEYAAPVNNVAEPDTAPVPAGVTENNAGLWSRIRSRLRDILKKFLKGL